MKKLYFILAVISISRCNCYDDCAFGTYDIPHSMNYIIKYNNSRLSDEILDNIKIYYFNDNFRTTMPDLRRPNNEINVLYYDLGVMTTREIGFISGEKLIKDFFIAYPNGDMDTLFVDYKSLSGEEACKHPCKCCCPIELIKFNGEIAQIDTSIKDNIVYIFNKK